MKEFELNSNQRPKVTQLNITLIEIEFVLVKFNIFKLKQPHMISKETESTWSKKHIISNLISN